MGGEGCGAENAVVVAGVVDGVVVMDGTVVDDVDVWR